jgi:hypothetical protein
MHAVNRNSKPLDRDATLWCAARLACSGARMSLANCSLEAIQPPSPFVPPPIRLALGALGCPTILGMSRPGEPNIKRRKKKAREIATT